MQVEILEHTDINALQDDINAFIEEIQWDENVDQINEIIDIKYVMTYNQAEKELFYSAMILYKSI